MKRGQFSEEEDAFLLEWRAAGVSVSCLAMHLSRQPVSVLTRLRKLGDPLPYRKNFKSMTDEFWDRVNRLGMATAAELRR